MCGAWRPPPRLRRGVLPRIAFGERLRFAKSREGETGSWERGGSRRVGSRLRHDARRGPSGGRRRRTGRRTLRPRTACDPARPADGRPRRRRAAARKARAWTGTGRASGLMPRVMPPLFGFPPPFHSRGRTASARLREAKSFAEGMAGEGSATKERRGPAGPRVTNRAGPSGLAPRAPTAVCRQRPTDTGLFGHGGTRLELSLKVYASVFVLQALRHRRVFYILTS